MPVPPKKKCVIVMPITVPPWMLERYRDGKDHFRHVMDCLFIPSIEEVGFEPVPPIADGSELVHDKIVGDLAGADLVLCDMSCLNPNVFFELGVRTALNKPVALVTDGLVVAPFDTNIIHCETYSPSLELWEAPSQRAKLAKHLRDTVEKSRGENALWKRFGMEVTAAVPATGSGTEAKLDLIREQLGGVAESVRRLGFAEIAVEPGHPMARMVDTGVRGCFTHRPLTPMQYEILPDSMRVLLTFDATPRDVDLRAVEDLRGWVARLGYVLEVEVPTKDKGRPRGFLYEPLPEGPVEGYPSQRRPISHRISETARQVPNGQNRRRTRPSGG